MLETSITHNKYLTFLFFAGNHSISAKSGAWILSLKYWIDFIFYWIDFIFTLSETVHFTKYLLSEYVGSWAKQALSNPLQYKCFKLPVSPNL